MLRWVDCMLRWVDSMLRWVDCMLRWGDCMLRCVIPVLERRVDIGGSALKMKGER